MIHCIPGEKSRKESVNRKLQMAHADHADRNMICPATAAAVLVLLITLR